MSLVSQYISPNPPPWQFFENLKEVIWTGCTFPLDPSDRFLWSKNKVRGFGDVVIWTDILLFYDLNFYFLTLALKTKIDFFNFYKIDFEGFSKSYKKKFLILEKQGKGVWRGVLSSDSQWFQTIFESHKNKITEVQ